jgi:hypothetical protein
MNRSQIVLYGLVTAVVLIAVVVLLRRELGLAPAASTEAVTVPVSDGGKAATEDILATMRRDRGERQPSTAATPTKARPPRAARQRTTPGAGQVERIGELLAATQDADEKIALLMELDGFTGPGVVDLLMRELDHGDSDVKLAILAILSDLADPTVIPAVDKALADQDPEIREAAIEVLGAIEEPMICAPLLARAIADDSEDVRDIAFSVLDDKLPEEQHIVFDESIASPHKSVREQTVDMISFNPSHRAFEILIRGLNDPDPEIVDEVKWTLDYFVSEEFETHDEALAWWQKNKHRFDEELFED